jgi:hypothetical protein
MLYACIQRFDVTGNLENFGELNRPCIYIYIYIYIIALPCSLAQINVMYCIWYVQIYYYVILLKLHPSGTESIYIPYA